jgi:flagellar protein FliO/FliZ
MKRFNKTNAIIGLISLLTILPAEAAKDTARASRELPFLPVLASLLVVVLVIMALAWLSKKMNLGFPGNRAIKVVTALSLGAKERIVVIEVNGKQHLIGVTTQQVNHLLTLDEPLEMGNPVQAGGLSFQKILQGMSKKND